MAPKKKQTTKKKKAAEKVEEQPVVEEVKEMNEEEKTYTIRFDSELEGKTFIEQGVKYINLPDRQREKISILPEPFIIKAGETKVIDQTTYDYLIEKKVLLTEEEKEEKDKFRAKKLKLKSGRAEPKKDIQTFTDEEKIKLFVDLPYIVVEEE